MASVARDDADRACSPRRRSCDDVVDDEPVATGGCDRSRGSSENVSSVFCEILRKSRSELVPGTSCPTAAAEAVRGRRGVVGASVDPPRSSTLQFGNDLSLTVFDDSEQYESFSIHLEGQASVYV